VERVPRGEGHSQRPVRSTNGGQHLLAFDLKVSSWPLAREQLEIRGTMQQRHYNKLQLLISDGHNQAAHLRVEQLVRQGGRRRRRRKRRTRSGQWAVTKKTNWALKSPTVVAGALVSGGGTICWKAVRIAQYVFDSGMLRGSGNSLIVQCELALLQNLRYLCRRRSLQRVTAVATKSLACRPNHLEG